MATLKSLTPELIDFLGTMTIPGVLSTLSPDGAPITSAVWFGLHEGDIVVATPATRNKARNARNDPRVSFIVDRKERPYGGVAVEGFATVIDDPDLAIMYSIARRYLGEPLPDWVHERYATNLRVILRIRPVRVRPWGLE